MTPVFAAGHPLLEVRRRAIQSLEFKAGNNLLKLDDLLQAGCMDTAPNVNLCVTWSMLSAFAWRCV